MDKKCFELGEMIVVSSNTVSCFEGAVFSFLFDPQVVWRSMWLVGKVASDPQPLMLTVPAGRGRFASWPPC